MSSETEPLVFGAGRSLSQSVNRWAFAYVFFSVPVPSNIAWGRKSPARMLINRVEYFGARQESLFGNSYVL